MQKKEDTMGIILIVIVIAGGYYFYTNYHKKDRFSLDIAKERYARGEISREDWEVSMSYYMSAALKQGGNNGTTP
jgi:uncharacterized membrane protein